ncbi:hypothetical protein AgCh_006741 [Apium graveolens]
MSVFLQASSAPSSPKAAEPEIVRRSSNYHPCVWGDHFLAYNTPDHATPDKDTIQKIEVLKEEVKKMLLKAAHQPQQQLKLIDDIQRLGLAYRFNVEIDVALKRMNEMHHELCRVKNMNDLHFVALCFRLLRQHGYNVSSDVFNKFKDESTGIFKESLNKDVDGLLSLYEATHLRVHGEDILEEALAFTTSHLESLKSQLKDPLATHVIRALEIPLWKSVGKAEDTAYVVGCYMRQHGVSREHTFAEFEKQKTQAWKDMNSECLRPTAVPIPLLMVALSSSRLVYASAGPPPPKAAEPDIVRRSSNYHPCVWGDHFLAYNTPDHATPDEDTVQKIEVLKAEVKKMLLEAASQAQQQLKLIDDIQRLGLAYHFEAEIEAALKCMNDTYHELCGDTNMNDLHFVALCFRLLRQQGYNVSSGMSFLIPL